MSYSEFDYAKTEIEGVTYKIRLLNTSEAFITAQEFLKLSLPSLGAFADGVKTMDDPFGDNTTFTAIAYSFVKQMGDVNVLELVKMLLGGTLCDGEPIDFEKHFRGKIGLLVKVIEFALKENYGSFFTDMGLREHLMSFIRSLSPQTQEQPKLEE